MRILIADDHELLRDTLLLYLRGAGYVVVDVGSLDDAILRLEDEHFDIVLLDFNMPGMAGLDGLGRALALGKDARIALISGVARRETAEQALAMGAAGFLPKTLSAKSFVNAVQFMALGEQFAPIDFMTAPDDIIDHPFADKLSRREMQVLKGLTEGKSNKEIARDLDIQEPTVKLHVKTLYKKVGAANRTQAAMIARDAGVF
ncbi:response regulator [Anianabacter salinae]|uniref:response regulator n=1 Tax=Anianabacter salinae TaxID=2851023 RepID=UPI00225E594E|nr:response regulator transcription factor [Anianabacter salinae]MBV0911137.1 response regulator transcription factor [Anianabacter salinae]